MELNRRDFFKLSGAALVVGLPSPAAAEHTLAPLSDQLAILYDSSKCIGCRACQMACKRWNNLPAESENTEILPVEAGDQSRLYDTPLGLTANTWTLIKLKKNSDTDWHFMNYQCMHCTDAACVAVCPSGALYKDRHGFTAYDRSKCIGCGYCTQFCPYGVPHLDKDSVLIGEGKAAKCTFCQDRVQSGIGGPFCATTCPVSALIWGPADQLLSQAKARVAELHEQGLDAAELYGESEAAGLRRLTILLGKPQEYNLPTSLPSLTVSWIWKNIIQVLGAAAIVGTTLAAFLTFLISRSHITMEDVE